MHRSPGVFFDHDKGKTHSSGKLLFACRIIPYRGSWLDFEFDAKDLVFARIDRRRKLPVTTLLYALGLDQEGIMDAYYDTVDFKLAKKNQGWVTKFFPERVRGTRPAFDLVDAKTGEVIAEAGKKVTPRAVKKLIDEGEVTELLVPFDQIVGRFVAKDIINEETGAIYVEAGDELTWELDKDGEVTGGTLKELIDAGITEIPVLDIDNVNVGPYMRNTMAADKNLNRDTALMDIYRVMRPGEPPTVEAASTLFNQLFFDSERYDLSAVGRVKMNMRLDLDAEDTQRTLRKEDIIACIKALVELRDGKGDIDDIDHLGNRRVRSVGELMENQYRVGLLRMERAIKERMSSVEIDTVMPQDLINAKPAAAAVREFFGSSQLSQFMDQTNPLGSHAQAPPFGAWAGRPDPGARGLRGARRAPDPLWPDVPDRDAGRPEYRPDQLARHLRAGEQVRLHRNALPQGRRRAGDRRGRLHVRDRGNASHRGAGQRAPDREGQIRERDGQHPPVG
jgi:DNA-directed RNA polymerase subunit beta